MKCLKEKIDKTLFNNMEYKNKSELNFELRLKDRFGRQQWMVELPVRDFSRIILTITNNNDSKDFEDYEHY